MIVHYTPTPNYVRDQFMVLQESMFKDHEEHINLRLTAALVDRNNTPILDGRVNAFRKFLQTARTTHKDDFDMFKATIDVEFATLIHFIWKNKY